MSRAPWITRSAGAALGAGKPQRRSVRNAPRMSTRTCRGDHAAADARRTVARVTTDLRDARLAADLSLDSAARAAGMSSSQLSRLELGRHERADFEQVWRAASVVGLRPSLM